ncbi:MAG: hypothetical protein KBS61_06550 [Chryseobacterium sp.]|nr:hypothetical protein [Candidatus Chryseobacterium enterohippi]
MYNNEREVADKAEQMLEASLRSKTSSFADHVNRREGDKSLKDAVSVAKVKNYGSVRDGNQKFFMRSLSIKMAKHGFIQNFGVDSVRDAGSRTRHRPQETTYNFRSHVMKMQAHPFIDEAVEASGVKEFVMSEIIRLRSEAIIVDVRRIISSI